MNSFFSTAVPQFNVTVVDELAGTSSSAAATAAPSSSAGVPAGPAGPAAAAAAELGGKGEGNTWDIMAGFNCNPPGSQIGFLHHTNVTGCEEACGADPACLEFILKLTDPCVVLSGCMGLRFSRQAECRPACSNAPPPAPLQVLVLASQR